MSWSLIEQLWSTGWKILTVVVIEGKRIIINIFITRQKTDRERERKREREI